MPKLDKIFFLALGDHAKYKCESELVTKEEIEEKLKSIVQLVAVWDLKSHKETLFITPASLVKLKEIKAQIANYEGQVYIAPDDDELEGVQRLFGGTRVIILYSNIEDFKGDHVARLVDTLICDDSRIKFQMVREEAKDWERVVGGVLSDFQEVGKLVGGEYNKKPSDGSLAMRVPEGFVVTASKSDKTNLTLEDLALVTKTEGGTMSYQGKRPPSSESLLYATAFKVFPKVGAIIHPHCWSKCAQRLPRNRISHPSPCGRWRYS